MPLFVALSGLFSYPKDWRSFIRSSITIAIPFIIFHALNLGISAIKHVPITWYSVLIPSMSLWYLVDLIIWRLILMLLPRAFVARPLWLFVLSCALSIALSAADITQIMRLDMVINFLPFFFLGFLLKSDDWLAAIKRIPMSVGVLAFASIAALSVFTKRSELVLALPAPCHRAIYIVFAIVNSVLFIRLVSPILSHKTLQAEGKNTMFYYIYQNYLGFVKRAIIRFLPVAPGNSLYCLFSLLLSLGILYMLRNNRLLKLPLSIRWRSGQT